MEDNAAELYQGPLLLGTFISLALFGAVAMQAYTYLLMFRRDRWYLVVLVIVLLAANTFQAIVHIAYSYRTVILSFGNSDVASRADWLLAASPATTGIVGCLVSSFFGWRVLILTKNIYIPALIVGLALANATSAIVTAYKVVVIGLYSQFHVFQTEVILWLASSTAADLLVTGSMVYYLQSHKTGFPSTDGTIDRIIRLTLQTGTLTAIIALVDLLLFLFLKDGIHFILNWMLINLYTISLLSSLNSRQGWHWDSSDHRPSSGPASASGQNRTRSGGREDMFTLTRPEVFIHVETHEMLSIDATADSKVQRLDLESGGAIDDERK